MRAEAFSSLLLPPECPWEAGTTCGEREQDTPKRASSKAKLDRGEAGRGQEQQRGQRAKGRPYEVSTLVKGLCRSSTPEASWGGDIALRIQRQTEWDDRVRLSLSFSGSFGSGQL